MHHDQCGAGPTEVTLGFENARILIIKPTEKIYRE